MEQINMKKYLICILIFLFVWVPVAVAKEIKEPQLENAVAWKPHWSLGVILIYDMEGLRVEFAHPLMANFPDSKCNEFQSDNNRLILITGGRQAWRYEAMQIATAYRIIPGEWQPVIQKTR